MAAFPPFPVARLLPPLWAKLGWQLHARLTRISYTQAGCPPVDESRQATQADPGACQGSTLNALAPPLVRLAWRIQAYGHD